MTEEVLFHGDEPAGVEEADLGKDLSCALDKMPAEWRCAILGQALGRRFLLNRRCRASRTTSKLTTLVDAVRESRDVTALMNGIQEALENGLDDESDIYFEAGNLLEELQVDAGDVDDDASENVMTSFQNSLYVE